MIRALRLPRRSPVTTETFVEMAVVVFGLSLASILARHALWLLIVQYGDKINDVVIVEALREGRSIAGLPARFLGFPLAILAVSRLTIDPWLAVALVSWLSALVALICVMRLYGPLVAAALLTICWDWTQWSIIGNTEPLFCALVFAGFVAIRDGKSRIGAILLALSTTVRPVGIFALTAYSVALVNRRAWRVAMDVAVIAMLVGIVYLGASTFTAGDPFTVFKGHQSNWQGAQLPIAIPLKSLYAGMREHLGDYNALAIARILATIAFGFGGTVLAALRVQEDFLPLNERLYLLLYVGFYLCYPSHGVFGQWLRYLMPVTPLVIAAYRPWLPDDRRMWWPLVTLSAVAIALNWRSFVAAVENDGGRLR